MSASPSLKKFGECLCRNPPSRTYFACVKHRSKEIKQSVKQTIRRSAAKTEGLQDQTGSKKSGGGPNFALLSNAENLRRITPSALHFRIRNCPPLLSSSTTSVY